MTLSLTPWRVIRLLGDYAKQRLYHDEQCTSVSFHIPWTNFSKQEETWAEFSTLKVAIGMLRIYGVIE